MSSSSDYEALKAEFAAGEAFVQPIPSSQIQLLAFLLMTFAFGLLFYTFNQPKKGFPLVELGSAFASSGLFGLGIVCVFCMVGVLV